MSIKGFLTLRQNLYRTH